MKPVKVIPTIDIIKAQKRLALQLSAFNKADLKNPYKAMANLALKSQFDALTWVLGQGPLPWQPVVKSE